MVTPFRVTITPKVITDLRTRLRQTRWPSPSPAPGWTQGTPLSFVQSLCDHWESSYDFRAAEERLNRHPQFRASGIHFVHVRSPRADAVPLLMTHGWPGSIVEFFDVITPLSESFHIVCPSLPGYGFSDAPTAPGFGVAQVADAWVALMDRLGYQRFVAQGHDWGTSVSTFIGLRHPSRVLGLHLVPPLVAPDPATFDSLTPSEQKALSDLAAAADGDGYSAVQATRPQTIGYGLVDSPAALCAWIVEKFHDWTDGDVLSRDQLLDNLMMYWLPGTGASAARLYWESFPSVQAVFRGDDPSVARPVTVPVGCSIFPRENPRPSRRWAARRFTDIRYWGTPSRGGHFAAFEQPELFVDEVRGCVAALLDLLPSG